MRSKERHLTRQSGGLRGRSSGVCLVAGLHIALALLVPAARGESTKDGRIEEIVVTAQRRQQGIQEVPVSMTALTSDFVLDAGLTDFNAIMQYAPNVSINTNADTRNTAVRIRGVGSVQNNAGIDPHVPFLEMTEEQLALLDAWILSGLGA